MLPNFFNISLDPLDPAFKVNNPLYPIQNLIKKAITNLREREKKNFKKIFKLSAFKYKSFSTTARFKKVTKLFEHLREQKKKKENIQDVVLFCADLNNKENIFAS
uniref:Uncharacterized protein n=1 Tax=Cacopsylla melanoneura TaxID=428564 RepID=A0A8D8QZE6_9HEMI